MRPVATQPQTLQCSRENAHQPLPPQAVYTGRGLLPVYTCLDADLRRSLCPPTLPRHFLPRDRPHDANHERARDTIIANRIAAALCRNDHGQLK
jgi:hypothetical protein